MSRVQRRRAQRDSARAVSESALRALTGPRDLPGDHPNPGGVPLLSSTSQAQRIRNAIDASGVVPYITRRLHEHPGAPSRLGAEALLTAMALTAEIAASYRRSDITAVLAGLDAATIGDLGLCERGEHWAPLAYTTVAKQVKRLERALRAGWVDDDGTVCDLEWLNHALLTASIPPEARAAITACAVDSTPFEAWAVTRDYSRVRDPVVEHRRDVLENPDLPEPDLTRFARKRGSGGIGTYGTDGRLQRTSDPDVRTGWRSAADKRSAGPFSGYDVTLAVSVLGVHWSGNPDKIAMGKPIPPYILGLDVTPGGTNPGPIGYRAVTRSLLVAPGIVEVAADRAYTVKREDFVRLLHRANIDVVMDYPERVRRRPTALTFRGGQETILEHCGTLLHHWTTPSLQAPPEDLTRRSLAAWHASRARLYRWSPHRNFDGGNKQFRCPVCAGRANSPTSATNSPTVPLIAAPPGATTCCGGLLTVNLEHLDRYQAVPYGTPAWQRSYGRRNQVENANKMLKDKSGLSPGSCRAFGTDPHTLAAMMLALVHNIAQTARTRVSRPNDATAPSQRRPAAPTPAHRTATPAAPASRAPP